VTAAEKEKRLQPLDVEEIDIARQRIEELHPLNDVRVENVLPHLCCCAKFCRKKGLSQGERAEEKDEEEDMKEVQERL